MSVIQNKKAYFDYEILEKLEAGIVLSGQEAKSAKLGQVSLKGAYITAKDGEFWLINAHISPYKYAGKLEGYDPTRSRKLLLHKQQILRLQGKRQKEALTIVPLSMYTSKRRIKVEIGLVRGKHKYDKRESIKKRETDRQIRQALKARI